jgi:hypothetical protein
MRNPCGKRQALRIPKRELCGKTIVGEVDKTDYIVRKRCGGDDIPSLKIEYPDPEKIEEKPEILPPPTPYQSVVADHDEEDIEEFYRRLLSILTDKPLSATYEKGLRVLKSYELQDLVMLMTGIDRCTIETFDNDVECCGKASEEKLLVRTILCIDDEGSAHDMRRTFHDCYESLSTYVCTKFVSPGGRCPV